MPDIGIGACGPQPGRDVVQIRLARDRPSCAALLVGHAWTPVLPRAGDSTAALVFEERNGVAARSHQITGVRTLRAAFAGVRDHLPRAGISEAPALLSPL